jgi:hypothetical protein
MSRLATTLLYSTVPLGVAFYKRDSNRVDGNINTGWVNNLQSERTLASSASTEQLSCECIVQAR